MWGNKAISMHGGGRAQWGLWRTGAGSSFKEGSCMSPPVSQEQGPVSPGKLWVSQSSHTSGEYVKSSHVECGWLIQHFCKKLCVDKTNRISMLSMCNHLCLKYQNFHVILFNKSYFVYSGKFTQFLGIDRRQYANDYNSTRSMYLVKMNLLCLLTERHSLEWSFIIFLDVISAGWWRWWKWLQRGKKNVMR